MSINCQANPCPIIVNASCVFYEGPNLICLGLNTNQTLEAALQKINSLFCQVLENQESNGTSGTSGTSGSSGTRGSSGINGSDGTSGTSGSNGRNGSSGATGSSGSNGSSGTSGLQGDMYRTVSETCFYLGNGGTLIVEPGLAYTPGQSIIVSVDALTYQICLVESYNNITGELIISIPSVVVGTLDQYCQWDVNLNGAAGGDGSNGTSGTNGSAGSNGSNGTSGVSCLSATILNTNPLGNANVEYNECDGTYQNYDILPLQSSSICFISNTLTVIGKGATINYTGICNGTSGTNGSAGTSGISCNSLEVTNITLVPKTYNYINCAGDLVEIEILAEQFISICAISWDIKEEFNIVNKGVCSGTSGTSGSCGSCGSGGGSSCPDHFKIAAVSGKFRSDSPNSPNISEMFVGNDVLGWSYGSYNTSTTRDGFGNLIRLKYDLSNSGIPLPIDLNVGDTIKISGIAYIPALTSLTPQPVNPTFYITVSRFNCSEVNAITNNTPLSTLISVASYPISLSVGKVCFSESIILSSVLASNETFFVVGLGIGNDNDPAIGVDVKFSYTLDVSQACIGTGKNILIRNCCDPAYTNIIIDNLVPIGESFVDTDGNCWTVENTTLSAVTAVRTLSKTFNNCAECISDNACPENFKIQSCCGDGSEVFSAALIGVNVGDTFVDTNGFCWSAKGTTPVPITNVVEVGTVYPITTCESGVCKLLNDCPHPVFLESCCGLTGYSTLELLQDAIPTLAGGDFFVDTFGMCWRIQDSAYAFPNVAFIIPFAETPKENGCQGCVAANPCPRDFYYTIQNCCTEEIEVVVLQALYNVGDSLLLELDVAYGCYKVLSWSDTGTVTATIVNVISNSKDCKECFNIMRELVGTYCQGQFQCCASFTNISELGVSIAGYKCDGTWLSNYIVAPNETICMALIVRGLELLQKQGCCGFDIRNPSPTAILEIQDYDICYNGPPIALPAIIVIPPLGKFTDAFFAQTDVHACLSCVYVVSSPYEYLPCPF